MKTKFPPDICIRRIIATAQVAVLFGLLLFLLSFCSCSSARKADQVSLSTSDTISMVSAKVDSVGSKTSESSWFNRHVEISGLEIIFPEPEKCTAEDTTNLASQQRASPKSIKIDALTVSASSGSSIVAEKDSLSAVAGSEKIVSETKTSEIKIRSPTATKWQVVIVLIFVLLVTAYTSYQLYYSNHPRDQTD